jgi:hypothetical protein
MPLHNFTGRTALTRAGGRKVAVWPCGGRRRHAGHGCSAGPHPERRRRSAAAPAQPQPAPHRPLGILTPFIACPTIPRSTWVSDLMAAAQCIYSRTSICGCKQNVLCCFVFSDLRPPDLHVMKQAQRGAKGGKTAALLATVPRQAAPGVTGNNEGHSGVSSFAFQVPS